MGEVIQMARTIRLSVDPSRLAGPVLVRASDPPWPPPGWTVETREPCAGGHGDGEDCDLCRAEAL